MTPTEIRAAIAASPELTALAAAGNTQVIADALSVGRTIVRTHRMSETGILEKYPGGPIAADAVLGKLEAFAASAHPLASVVRRALKFLATPDGLDIGSPATQTMLDALANGGVITVDEATALKALATVADPITHQQIGAALQGAQQ